MQVAYCIEDLALASSTWTERLNLARVRLRRAVVGQMTHPTGYRLDWTAEPCARQAAPVES